MTDRRLSKGEYVVVCLQGARIEHVTERVENVLGHGQGGSIFVHGRTMQTGIVQPGQYRDTESW